MEGKEQMTETVVPTAAVLGASPNGIGRAVVEMLNRIGMDVYATNLEDLDVRTHYKLQGFLADTDPDYVVYCVGMNKLDWIKDWNSADFRDIMDVNVGGFINVIADLAALDSVARRQDRKPRSIVAVTSDAAFRPMRTSINYCASKAALDMAVKVAAREMAEHGWRVNGVAPGKVAGTAMTQYVDATVPELRGWTAEAAAAYERASSATQRAATTEEVASVICDVLLNESRNFTGAIIPVNGGR